MANPADVGKLAALHDKVATVLADALDGQRVPEITDEDGEVIQPEQIIAPSAAIITASIQFLKNNDITCAPSDDNALGALKSKMEARQAKRAARAKPDAVDLHAAGEQAGWLGNQLPN